MKHLKMAFYWVLAALFLYCIPWVFILVDMAWNWVFVR